jgi:hypothetical protein
MGEGVWWRRPWTRFFIFQASDAKRAKWRTFVVPPVARVQQQQQRMTAEKKRTKALDQRTWCVHPALNLYRENEKKKGGSRGQTEITGSTTFFVICLFPGIKKKTPKKRMELIFLESSRRPRRCSSLSVLLIEMHKQIHVFNIFFLF